MSLVDFIINRKNRKNNDVSVIFENNNTAISAEHAYQKSKFGCLKSEKELLTEFFRYVQDTITDKNLIAQYSAIIEIGPDILDFMPKIVEKLTKELRYKVVVLNDDVEITNTKTNITDTINSGGITYVLLFWNKESVQEMKQLYTVSVENTENFTDKIKS